MFAKRTAPLLTFAGMILLLVAGATAHGNGSRAEPPLMPLPWRISPKRLASNHLAAASNYDWRAPGR